MSHKFSIVIEIKDGKVVAHGFHKADAADANSLFNKLRDEKKEAYFFQHPVADKRCKSADQIEATQGRLEATPATTPVAPVQVALKSKKVANKIEGVGANSEVPSEPTAIDIG
jgi:hypothetical protein